MVDGVVGWCAWIVWVDGVHQLGADSGLLVCKVKASGLV